MNFQITIELATAYFCSSPLTLDALLSAAIYNATGEHGEEAEGLMPLEKESGVFHGSALFCVGKYQHESFSRIMALRMRRDVSTDYYHPNKRSKKYTKIDPARGPYKNGLDSYRGIRAQEVLFYGRGDAEVAAQLIRSFIPGIGKRMNAGAGEIISVEWQEITEDYSWVLANGTPARPLPVSVWEKTTGNPASTRGVSAVTLPTWSAPRVDVVLPERLVV